MLLVNTPQIIVESKRNLREERLTFEGRKVRLFFKKNNALIFLGTYVCVIFFLILFFLLVRESFVFRSCRVQDFRA